ncbi:MAG: hypothetical protein GY926_25675 [bacterium]|nr:hypothetical protein [bacterium]
MGYEAGVATQVLNLLELFEDRVPDDETHRMVVAIVGDRSRWPDAHEAFSQVRTKLLASKDELKGLQYHFCEACLQTFYNETPTRAPFDSISPYFVLPAALNLAHGLGIELERVRRAASY